jgi:hypothetical protein
LGRSAQSDRRAARVRPGTLSFENASDVDTFAIDTQTH